MKIPLPFSWGITWLLGVASVLADDVDWRKFSFGTGRPLSGFVKVLPSTIYQSAGGFGFEPGADIVAYSDFASSGHPFFFSVKVPEGNYRVRIALGPDLDQAFQDGTHHNNYGSYLLAQCVAAGIESAGLRLAEFLVADVKNFDPRRPLAVEEFHVPPSPRRSIAKLDSD